MPLWRSRVDYDAADSVVGDVLVRLASVVK
jgi:hypothetical protein